MFRCCLFLLSFCFAHSVFADQHIDDEECDSNRIHYAWIENYGDVEEPDADGQSLFNSATDKLEVLYARADKICFEANVLVIDYILTMPRRDQRQLHENREYLSKKLHKLSLKIPQLLDEILTLAPSINMLWNDYQDHLAHRDVLEKEYQDLALAINTQACDEEYSYDRDGADYDAFMNSCVSRWK